MREYNRDINQPGASLNPRISVDTPSAYFVAVVEDIILNETHRCYKVTTDKTCPPYNGDFALGANVGMALLRLLPNNINVATDKLMWVLPLDSTMREYPLVNEIVLVFKSLGGLLYTRRVNTTNKITDGKFIGIKEAYSGASATPSSEAVVMASRGGVRVDSINDASTDPSSTDGKYVENPLVKMLRHTEGDMTIQGRFGNSIRFGSSLFSNPTDRIPRPNLLIRVGPTNATYTSTYPTPTDHSLVFEDINTDNSSIWMVSNETVALKPATIDSVSHLRSSELSDSKEYTGAQIFVNSDRVILNSKQNEISLFSNAEINLSAVQSITIDSANAVMITADRDITLTTPRDIVLTGRTISLNSPNDISQGTSGNYTISGRKIFIGSGGDESQPMVLGGELASWLQTVVFALTLLPLTFIPSPSGVASAAQLAQYIKELQAKLGVPGIPQSAIFNSTSNFTSKTN
jgi:hypothetical protein